MQLYTVQKSDTFAAKLAEIQFYTWQLTPEWRWDSSSVCSNPSLNLLNSSPLLFMISPQLVCFSVSQPYCTLFFQYTSSVTITFGFQVFLLPSMDTQLLLTAANIRFWNWFYTLSSHLCSAACLADVRFLTRCDTCTSGWSNASILSFYLPSNSHLPLLGTNALLISTFDKTLADRFTKPFYVWNSPYDQSAHLFVCVTFWLISPIFGLCPR